MCKGRKQLRKQAPASQVSVSQQGADAVSAGPFCGEVLGHKTAWAAPTEVGGGRRGKGLGPCTMAFLSTVAPEEVYKCHLPPKRL